MMDGAEYDKAMEDKFDFMKENGLLKRPRAYPHCFSPIYVPHGDAWIMGEQNHYFTGLDVLLIHLGCEIEAVTPEAHEAGGCRVVHPMSKVTFPMGATIIKRPKEEDTGRTASGRRRRRAPKERRLTWSLNNRKGQILIPGEDTDYIVTWYKRTEFSPEMFDRGVHEVEKE
jgi:hypothetical protein